MTRAQYKNLWDNLFTLQADEASIPQFDEYLLRENQLEDYLDIFRGFNTRPEREGTAVMPYPHPYFNSDGVPKLTEIPKIKYLLVAESAMPLRPSIPVNGCNSVGGDKANTYFYDITHLKSTPYLSSPRIAFSCHSEQPCPENKINTLLSLASKGVLLMDLFPFALSYNTEIRQGLNVAGVTESFWNDPVNPYSLQNRLHAINALIDSKWDLALIAPCKISSFIIDTISLFPALAVIPGGIHPAKFRDHHSDTTRCGAAKWKKLGVTSAGSPSSHLIEIAFLP